MENNRAGMIAEKIAQRLFTTTAGDKADVLIQHVKHGFDARISWEFVVKEIRNVLRSN